MGPGIWAVFNVKPVVKPSLGPGILFADHPGSLSVKLTINVLRVQLIKKAGNSSLPRYVTWRQIYKHKHFQK